MRHPECAACLFINQHDGFECDGTGFRCDNEVDRIIPRPYRPEATCETCYRPATNERIIVGDICSKCEESHPAPEFLKAYKKQLEAPDLSVDDHLAAAEEHKPGVTSQLKDRLAAYRQRTARSGSASDPKIDFRQKLDEFRAKKRLVPLAEAAPLDPRDRTTSQLDLILYKQIAGLQAARQANGPLPRHYHPSLVRDLEIEENNLHDWEEDIVAYWRNQFINAREEARREKARS